MARNSRVRMNPAGSRALLRSPEVVEELERRAMRIADAAGEGMDIDIEIGPERARVSVRTATRDAVLAEHENRALTHALDAGRN